MTTPELSQALAPEADTNNSPTAKDKDNLDRLFAFDPFVYALPRRQLMKQIQNSAEQALENPRRFSFRLRVLSGPESKPDVDALLHAQDTGEDRDVYAHHQGRAAVAIERRLDELQLKLSHHWLSTVRVTALVVGVITSIVLAGIFDVLQIREFLNLAGLVVGTIAAIGVTALMLLLFPFNTSTPYMRVLFGLCMLLPLGFWFSYVFFWTGDGGPDQAPNMLMLLCSLGLVAGFTSTVIYDLVQRVTGEKRV